MKYLLTMFVYLFAVGCSNAFPSKHDAEVLYWHEVKDGQHYYYYNVVNNSSTSNIVHISVGYKYDDNYGEPQLFAPAKDRTHIPLEFISPEGWNGKIEYVEESLNYSLGWRTSAGAKFNIPPNSSSYQFGVVLDNERNDHITSYFTIIFSDSTVTTKQMGTESGPPKSTTLAPIYDLLLSKGLKPMSMEIATVQ